MTDDGLLVVVMLFEVQKEFASGGFARSQEADG